MIYKFFLKNGVEETYKILSYYGAMGEKIDIHFIDSKIIRTPPILCMSKSCNICKLRNKLIETNKYEKIQNVLKSRGIKFNLNPHSVYFMPVVKYMNDKFVPGILKLWESELFKILAFIYDNELFESGNFASPIMFDIKKEGYNINIKKSLLKFNVIDITIFALLKENYINYLNNISEDYITDPATNHYTAYEIFKFLKNFK